MEVNFIDRVVRGPDKDLLGFAEVADCLEMTPEAFQERVAFRAYPHGSNSSDIRASRWRWTEVIGIVSLMPWYEAMYQRRKVKHQKKIREARRVRGRKYRESRAVESTVYFLSSGTLIKIGFTGIGARSRLAAIQTMSPQPVTILATVPGDMQYEKELHLKFKHLRSHGEWFRAEPELLEFIGKAKASAGGGLG